MQFRFDLEVGLLLLLLNVVGTIVPLGRDLEEELPFAGVVLQCLRYNEFVLLTDGTVIFLTAFETVLTPLMGALGDGLTLSEEVFFGRPTALLTEPVRLFAFDFLELCAFTFLEPPSSLLGCALGDFAATLGIFAGGGEGESSAGRP